MRRPEPVDDDECPSCGGYGFFDSKTERPTIDRRGRKCLDCSGTGKKLVKDEHASACRKKDEKLVIPPLKKGMFVYFRSHGAERVGEILEPGRKDAKIRWWIPSDDDPREKWVPYCAIYRELQPHEDRKALPTREGPFRCMDPGHNHPSEYLRDECVRKTGGRR